MSKIDDVAAYILEKFPEQISAMKLQKLVYYSQAWHAVWEEKTLFDDPILAWANGPVAYSLYDKHRGKFLLSSWTWGQSSNLEDCEKESIDLVLSGYGQFTAAQLSALTHSEDPWKDARAGLAPGERSDNVIEVSAMVEYYEAFVGVNAES